MTETATIQLTRRATLRTPNNDPTNQERPKNIQEENEEPQGNGNSSQEPPPPQAQPPPASNRNTWRSWAVFPALCVTTFLASLDTSILSTTLPTIALDLHAGDLYMWITNAYILSLTVVLPLFGQIPNIFGRQ